MAGGQAVGHCGKVGGQSDELAPAMGSLGVYTVGQVHGRCYRMRILDQLGALVAAADAGEGDCVSQRRIRHLSFILHMSRSHLAAARCCDFRIAACSDPRGTDVPRFGLTVSVSTEFVT